MNCGDIARILDNDDVAGLTAARREAARLHMAACEDCAADWAVHEGLAGTTIPAVPAQLRARYPLKAAHAGGWRRRQGFIVSAALLAVAAAASMILGSFSPGPPAAADPAAMAGVEDISAIPDEGDGGAAADAVTPPDPSSAAAISAPAPVVAPPAAARHVVLVMPLAHESGDPAAWQAAGILRSALLAELRRMPDVLLQEAGSGDSAPAGAPQFRLTVTSLVLRVLSSGSLEIGHTDGSSSGTSAGFGDELFAWPVEIRLDQLGSPHYQLIMTFADPAGAPGRMCTTVGALPSAGFNDMAAPGAVPACQSVAALAGRLAAIMRQASAPARPAEDANLIAVLRDRAASPGVSDGAAMEVMARLRRGNAGADVIAALVDHISRLPAELRATMWTSLHGSRDPALVEPLLRVVQDDADHRVRAAALAVLAANFGRDPAVPGAIELASRQDRHELVRTVAMAIATSDPTAWRNYVLATLRDARLSFADRIEPLLLSQSMGSVAALAGNQPALIDNEEVVSTLVQLLRGGWSDAGQRQATANVLGVLAASQQPAAIDVQIEILQEAANLDDPTLARRIALTLLTARDVPGVREALEQVMNGDGNRLVRDMIERELGRSAASGASPRLP